MSEAIKGSGAIKRIVEDKDINEYGRAKYLQEEVRKQFQTYNVLRMTVVQHKMQSIKKAVNDRELRVAVLKLDKLYREQANMIDKPAGEGVTVQRMQEQTLRRNSLKICKSGKEQARKKQQS